MKSNIEIDRHPNVVWEVTRACALQCGSCPTGAQPMRSVRELSTYDSYRMIDEIAGIQPSRFIITGGDPLRRDDVFDLVHHARDRSLDPTIELSPTPMLTRGAVDELRACGVNRVALALDDVDPRRHDARRGLSGQYLATVTAMGWAAGAGLEFEINTLVDRHNLQHLGAMLTLAEKLGAAAWNLHILVPAGASKTVEMITAIELEQLFAFADGAATSPVRIRVHEAPQYRRYHLQSFSLDGTATIFITHTGDVQPGPFIPIYGGNVRRQALSSIYEGGQIFVALRDESRLTGKCGRCPFRCVCGGSRARALAMSGDLFASDPLCAYDPDAVRSH
jgi:radical SAM protein with 4Fe4S-binding SPASM domain